MTDAQAIVFTLQLIGLGLAVGLGYIGGRLR